MERPRNGVAASLGIHHSHLILCGLSETALPIIRDSFSCGPVIASHFSKTAMEFRRKTLPHDPPNWLDPTQESFFITINCQPRSTNQLALSDVWAGMIESIAFREQRNEWKWRLILAMPDHLHGIVSFPTSFSMRKSISNWKRWIAKGHSITWQRDFFDHRLRSEASAIEKANYIRMNPVRAGLVASPDQWPYVR